MNYKDLNIKERKEEITHISKVTEIEDQNIAQYLVHTTNEHTWIVPKRSSTSSTARSTCIKISLKAEISKNK